MTKDILLTSDTEATKLGLTGWQKADIATTLSNPITKLHFILIEAMEQHC